MPVPTSRAGWCRDPPHLIFGRGCGAVTPLQGARHPPRPERACAPLPAAGALGTLGPWSCPRRRVTPPRGPSPSGVRHSPYPRVSTPTASRTRATPGISLSHLLWRGGAGGARLRPRPRPNRCVSPGPHGAVGQQCQLRERCVGTERGPGDCARSLPPPLRVLSCQGLGGGGGVSTSCPPPSSQAGVGKEQGSG